MAIHGLVPRRFGRRVVSAPPVVPVWREWDDLFDRFSRGDVAPLSDFTPRIDVSEADGEIRVRAELPGLTEKDFEVLVEGTVLTLKGEKRTEHEEKREGYTHVETSSGSFHRAFELPFEVDPDRVKAHYAQGVLTVTIERPEEAERTRAIPVSTG